MISIELPIPELALRPNSGTHFKGKFGPKEAARYEAANQSKKYRGVFTKDQLLKATVIFSFTDKRSRDTDNLLASFKHHQDGVFIGLQVGNDKKQHLNDGQIAEMRVIRRYKQPKEGVKYILEAIGSIQDYDYEA